MAKTKKRTAGQRGTRNRKGQSLPGWLYLLMGLAVGLAVAGGVYINDRRQQPPAAPVQVLPKPPRPAPAPAAKEPAADEINFDFYELLPNLDVEVYTETKRPVNKPQPVEVKTAGVYILQAGSFSKLEDANRRKAEMALLGVRSEIRKGAVKDRTVYRVYTHPMENPADVNRTSDLLVSNGIEIMLKRVSD